jgi:hypothetical protein
MSNDEFEKKKSIFNKWTKTNKLNWIWVMRPRLPHKKVDTKKITKYNFQSQNNLKSKQCRPNLI